MQNISQSPCSTLVNTVLIHVFFQSEGFEYREKRENGHSAPHQKDTSLWEKLLHSCSLRGFDKLMNFSFLFSSLSTSTVQMVPVLQSSAHFLCQQPPGNPHTLQPLEPTANCFEVIGKSISLGPEETFSHKNRCLVYRLCWARPASDGSILCF